MGGVMNKAMLRQLGWSEELIEVAASARRPTFRPIPVASSTIRVSPVTVGAATLDLSNAPVVASTAIALSKPSR